MIKSIRGITVIYSLPHHLKPIKIQNFPKFYDLIAANWQIPKSQQMKLIKKNWPLIAKSLHSETFSGEVMATLNILDTSSQYSALDDTTYLQLMQTNFGWNPHLSSKPMVFQNYNSLLDWKLYKLYLHYIFINHGKTKNNCKF